MFDQLKGMASMAGLLKDLPRIKAELEQVKQRLANMEVEAESGGGAVTAIATGDMRLHSIRIDRTMLTSLIDPSDPSDAELAQELVVGAVNAALVKAKEAAAQEMAKAAEELGIPLPSGDVGGLLS